MSFLRLEDLRNSHVEVMLGMRNRKAGYLQSGLGAQRGIQWKNRGCGSARGVYGDTDAFLWLDCEVYEGKSGQKVEK